MSKQHFTGNRELLTGLTKLEVEILEEFKAEMLMNLNKKMNEKIDEWCKKTQTEFTALVKETRFK